MHFHPAHPCSSCWRPPAIPQHAAVIVYNSFLPTRGRDTLLWSACVSSTPCSISHKWEKRFYPPHYFASVWDGPAASTQLPLYESQTLIPKLTFLCQFSPLLLAFWCPNWNFVPRDLGANPWVAGGKRAGKNLLSSPLHSRRWKPGPRAIGCFLPGVLRTPWFSSSALRDTP